MNWAGNTLADLCEADVHRTDRLAEYRAGDQIIQRDSNIRVIYILKDHLGSCGHKLLENNGLWRYEETTPFGQTVMSGYRLNTQQKKFVGKEQDESGLYHMGARMYDPWQCRFVSVDPLWRENSHEGGYVYAGDNPIMFTDPTGMNKEGAGGGDPPADNNLEPITLLQDGRFGPATIIDGVQRDPTPVEPVPVSGGEPKYSGDWYNSEGEYVGSGTYSASEIEAQGLTIGFAIEVRAKRNSEKPKGPAWAQSVISGWQSNYLIGEYHTTMAERWEFSDYMMSGFMPDGINLELNIGLNTRAGLQETVGLQWITTGPEASWKPTIYNRISGSVGTDFNLGSYGAGVGFTYFSGRNQDVRAEKMIKGRAHFYDFNTPIRVRRFTLGFNYSSGEPIKPNIYHPTDNSSIERYQSIGLSLSMTPKYAKQFNVLGYPSTNKIHLGGTYHIGYSSIIRTGWFD